MQVITVILKSCFWSLLGVNPARRKIQDCRQSQIKIYEWPFELGLRLQSYFLLPLHLQYNSLSLNEIWIKESLPLDFTRSRTILQQQQTHSNCTTSAILWQILNESFTCTTICNQYEKRLFTYTITTTTLWQFQSRFLSTTTSKKRQILLLLLQVEFDRL